MSTSASEAAGPGGIPVISSGRRRTRAGVAAGILSATTYVYAVDPSRPGHYPLCPLYAATGLYCPGCGMLRATHAALHGDIATSLAFNPLLVPVAVLAGFLLLRRLARGRGPVWPWALTNRFAGFFAAAFVLFTIARNVPGWTWLSPA